MAELLGIDKEQIRQWLCNRKIVTAQETVTKPLTAAQVSSSFRGLPST
jgi:myosin V